MWAIVEVETSLSFIVRGVIHVFGFIQAQHFLFDLLNFWHTFFKRCCIGEIHERMLGIGVPAKVMLVIMRTCAKIMFIFESAWSCFEGS